MTAVDIRIPCLAVTDHRCSKKDAAFRPRLCERCDLVAAAAARGRRLCRGGRGYCRCGFARGRAGCRRRWVLNGGAGSKPQYSEAGNDA